MYNIVRSNVDDHMVYVMKYDRVTAVLGVTKQVTMCFIYAFSKGIL